MPVYLPAVRSVAKALVRVRVDGEAFRSHLPDLAVGLVSLADGKDDLDKDAKHRWVRDRLVPALDDAIVFEGPAGGILEQIDGVVLKLAADLIIKQAVRSRRRHAGETPKTAKDIAAALLEGALDAQLGEYVADGRKTVREAAAARLVTLGVRG